VAGRVLILTGRRCRGPVPPSGAALRGPRAAAGTAGRATGGALLPAGMRPSVAGNAAAAGRAEFEAGDERRLFGPATNAIARCNTQRAQRHLPIPERRPPGARRRWTRHFYDGGLIFGNEERKERRAQPDSCHHAFWAGMTSPGRCIVAGARCWYCDAELLQLRPRGGRPRRFCGDRCRGAWRRRRTTKQPRCAMELGGTPCPAPATAQLTARRPTGTELRYPVCDECRRTAWTLLTRSYPMVGWQPIRYVSRWPRGICACCGHRGSGTRYGTQGWAACPTCRDTGCDPRTGHRRCGHTGPPPTRTLPGWE
jgi:hypothetical protein